MKPYTPTRIQYERVDDFIVLNVDEVNLSTTKLEPVTASNLITGSFPHQTYGKI